MANKKLLKFANATTSDNITVWALPGKMANVNFVDFEGYATFAAP